MLFWTIVAFGFFGLVAIYYEHVGTRNARERRLREIQNRLKLIEERKKEESERIAEDDDPRGER